MGIDHDVGELEKAIEKIWDLAHGFGLDPFPTHFELVPASIMYEFGSYGLPGRFSHWTHGKAYYRMKTSYDYGLSKIYELVINTNPSYAFLMEANSVLQNKLVAAHVLGHTDFFKNNQYFRHTSKQMIEQVSLNAERIRNYEYERGHREVEEFLDAVLSVQEHINPNLSLKEKNPEEKPDGPRETDYDDLWSLSKDPLETKKQEKPKVKKFPEEPDKDLLRFLMKNAPELEEWQRDIISIVRMEMLYFVPQMQTKIMNEGWASYWHSRIMRELELTDTEYTEFASLHSGVLSPSRTHLNPYYLGFKMFEDIESRWDSPSNEQQALGYARGDGRKKMFEVREEENDVSFLRSYLTKDLIEELDLYIYKREGDEWVIVEKNWEKIRDMIVQSMTNFGNPYLMVEDADYKRNRELYIKHYFEGQEMDLVYAEKTLQHLYKLWNHSVHLETVWEGKRILLTFDGDKNTRSTLDKS